MYNKYILITFFPFLLFSCGSSEKKAEVAAAPEVPITITEIKTGDRATVKTVAQLEIEGMTCAIGCAATIRKALSDVPGVDKAEVDFDENRKSDFAEVIFDPAIVRESQLAATVQQLADGQYKVHRIVVKKYVYSESLEPQKVEKDQSAVIDIKISFPNILEVFTLILK